MEFSNKLGTFIEECINFKYSYEAYELDKMSKEIELMHRYIEHLDFVENDETKSFNESFYNPDESYFSENNNTVIVDKKSNIGTQVSVKEETLVKRIINGFIKFFDRIAKFIGRVVSNYLYKEDIAKIAAFINNTHLTNEDVQTIINEYSKRSTKWNFEVESHRSGVTYKNGTARKKVTPHFEEKGSMTYLATAILFLVLDDQVTVKPKKDMIGVDDLSSFVDSFADKLNGKQKKDILSEINNAIAYSKKNGINVNFSENELTPVENKLNDLKKELEQYNAANSGLMKDRTLNKSYTTLIAASGEMIQTISAISQFRKDMIGVLSTILSKYPGVKK